MFIPKRLSLFYQFILSLFISICGALLLAPSATAVPRIVVPQVAVRQMVAPPDPQTLPPTGDCIVDTIYYGAVPPGRESAPVLVFVYGLAGVVEDWWTDQTIAGLNDMYILAYEAGYRTAFANQNLNPEMLDPAAPEPTGESDCVVERRPSYDFSHNGEVLSQQFAAIIEHYAVEQVDIIAHSKGGIDTQAAITWFGASDSIQRVFTLATPHQGTPVVDMLWSPEGFWISKILGQRDRGTLSLTTNVMQAFRDEVDANQANTNIQYFWGAGNEWNRPDSLYELTGEWLQEQPNGGDNDGVVTVSSAELSYATPLFVKPWNHVEAYMGRNAFPYIQQHLLADIAPNSLYLSGPVTGTVGLDYRFTATAPISLTEPITYAWQATDSAPQVHVSHVGDSAIFTWASTGTKQILLSATNVSQTITTTHFLDLEEPTNLTAPTGLQIQGPVRGGVDTGYRFDAVLPVTVTQPVEYFWQVTDHSSITNSARINDSIIFNWSIAGTKQLIVTATNVAGVITTTHRIDIEAPNVVAPTSLQINGPGQGFTHQRHLFDAMVLPMDTTRPLLYKWNATDHPDVTNSGNESAIFSWATAGTKQITVTVTNAAAIATATYEVVIKDLVIEGTHSYVPFAEQGQNSSGKLSGRQTDALLAASAGDEIVPGMTFTTTTPIKSSDLISDYLRSNYIVRGGRVDGAVHALIPIEAEAQAVEFSIITSDPLSFVTLSGPDGSIVLANRSAMSSQTFLADATMFHYRLDQPVSGDWLVRIRTLQPTAYLLLATFDSSLQVEIQGASFNQHLPEQAINWQATASVDDVSAQVEQISMQLNRRQAETVEPDFNYASSVDATLSYISPSEAGLYGFSITVSGQTPEGSRYERSFIDSMLVTPANNSPDGAAFWQAFFAGD